jgi:hypothetical protein
VDLAPNTVIRLDFDEDGNLRVTLITGCVIVRAKRNTQGEILTEQGTAAKNEKAAGGLLDVCFPPGAAGPTVGQGAAASAGAGASGAGAGAGAGAGVGGGIGAAATTAVILGGIGGAVALVFAFKGDNGSPSTP